MRGSVSSTNRIHRGPDFTDSRCEPYEDRAADYRMANVELLDLGNSGDRAEISRRQSVTRMDSQLELRGEPRGFA